MEIELYKSARDRRRELSEIPAVMEALEPAEGSVFHASLERPILSYDAKSLVKELSTALKWIARDVGYRMNDESDMEYLVFRTAEILRAYYSDFSLMDFKMAFEMCITGNLDPFLPKNGNGQPDRSHYQQFNAEYVCKILNAYKLYRKRIIGKAADAVPATEKPIDDATRALHRNYMKTVCIFAFLHYKYRGYLPALTPIAVMRSYALIAEAGFAEPMEVSMREQDEILSHLLVKKNGKYNDIRRWALEKAFDEMVKEEVQIMDYIKPEDKWMER